MTAQSIDRVEPPNWWTGMKNTRVQIMLSGQDIAHLTAVTDYKGLSILGTETPGSDHYLFIDIEIHPGAVPGSVPIILQREGKEVIRLDYPLWSREAGSAARKGFGPQDVIYLVTPDRFANGDPANDRVDGMKEMPDRTSKNGRHGGDIEGIRQHLDYIRDMGFTALWPNPVLENNMPVYSYHGYAITDFYKVDPRMGGNASYRNLCREASQMGIKSIMDMVVNHCGSGHPWMKDPPTKDWFNYADEPYTPTNHIKTIHMDPYAAKGDRRIMEEGWFVETMPDLNTENPWLATYLIQNSIWWVEYAGLHGIRMDTYPYPEESFMSSWSKAVMAEYPGLNIVGEVWYDKPAGVAYWQAGHHRTHGPTSYLPAVFDFPLHLAMVRALNTNDEHESGWFYLYEMLAQDFLYPHPFNLVPFSDNHDMGRIFSQLDNNPSRLKNALAFLLTVRGIPQLYYGTEIMMPSTPHRDDGLARSDFPGGWKGDTVNAFTGEGLSTDQHEMKLFVKHVLHWRMTASAIHHGKTIHFVPREGVYVLFRLDEQQKIMIILNKNEGIKNLSLERFRPVLGQATTGMNIIDGKTISLGSSLSLEGANPMIIEFK